MKKVIVITGPTGVGKTKLSVMLAKYLNSEIINSDAYQIYQDMNIGTANPTEKEMDGVKQSKKPKVGELKAYTIHQKEDGYYINLSEGTLKSQIIDKFVYFI